MKKYTFALAALLVCLSSCSESFLDREPSYALTPSTFWKTENDAKIALVGCYRQLYSPYRPEEMWFWETTSDNAFCYHRNKDYRAIGDGSMAPSGVSVHNYFTYQDLRTLNEYLEKEKSVDFENESLRNQYRAEVRLIRAMLLAFKVHCYGDFPFSETVFETVEESKIARTPKAELLSFIEDEVTDIVNSNVLPETSEVGRINKYVAEAFLVRFYMGTGNYDQAIAHAKVIMDSGKYFMPQLTYEQSFLVANQHNSEIILSFEHSKAGDFGMWVAEFFPNQLYGGWSSIVPTQDLLESYETINGLTIDEDPIYDKNNPFINRDPRLRATILYPGQVWDKYTKEYGGYRSIEKGSGDYWSDADNATHTGMNFKKFYSDPSELGDIWSCERNFPIFRYAEVLLSYAEAKMEKYEIDNSVYEAIDQVRVRAGMPKVDRAKYSTQAKLRELIRRERRVEFAYEGIRRFDIIRWGIIGDVMGGQKIYHMNGTIGTFNPTTGDFDVQLEDYRAPSYTDIEEIRQFTKGKNELLPVPQTERDLNDKLSQNPGY